MATLNQVIQGLQIFAKHGDGDSHDICAAHDCIYAGVDVVDKLTDEDKAKLEELGWHWDHISMSWARFV